ncbi:hypothetical protein BN3662_02588 [Clostridiales bacterium CHKCI006]|uniref:Uncharacterized protein n=1 Tax=Candidatus Fimiplasma intestinipullorum TaxID=2840825 RepID=A0A9D1HPS0_9FIRM|nr:hypothetical protein BN3662_02588 [Clostridiales bacterium CHKCI006]HIU13687.1 hypothetical protein [Candidatus Fimiplasma intestinipullorum]
MEIKERDLEVTLPYILRLLGQRYHFQVLQPAMKMTDEQLYLKGVIEYGRMKFAFDTCLKAGIERGYPYIEMVRGKVDGPWLKGDLYELAKRYLGHLRDIKWANSRLYLMDWGNRVSQLTLADGMLTIEFF